MRNFIEPAFIAPPSKCGLWVSSSGIRFNWKAPISLPFQASGTSWRSITNEYTISFHSELSTESATTRTSASDIPIQTTPSTLAASIIPIGSGKTQWTDVSMPIDSDSIFRHSSSSDGYFIGRVRACVESVCSVWSKAKNRAFRSNAAFRPSKGLVYGRAVPGSGVDSSTTSSGNIGGGGVLDLMGVEIPEELRPSYCKLFQIQK